MKTIEIALQRKTSRVEIGVERGKAKPLQSKSVTPTTSQQTVTPDTGFYGLHEVTVEAAPTQSLTVTPTTSQQTVTPTDPYIGLSSVTVNSIAYYTNSTIHLIATVVDEQQVVTDIETIINEILQQ